MKINTLVSMITGSIAAYAVSMKTDNKIVQGVVGVTAGSLTYTTIDTISSSIIQKKQEKNILDAANTFAENIAKEMETLDNEDFDEFVKSMNDAVEE
jgi:hypothetical protein